MLIALIILANLTAMLLTASVDYWELVDILAVIIGGIFMKWETVNDSRSDL